MPTANPKKIDILRFEDNGVDVDLISEHLELSNLDCNISIATRLTDGVEQLEKRRFDVVLLNLTLPDSRGIDTLLATIEASQDEAIIALTGTDDEELSLEALKLGAQDYLIKYRLNSEDLRRPILFAIELSNLLRSR